MRYTDYYTHLLIESVDDAYLQAAESENLVLCQQMVDTMAKQNRYNVGPVYHNTTSIDWDFTVFEPRIKKRFDGSIASKYGLVYFSDERPYVHSKSTSKTFKCYLKIQNAWDFRNTSDVNLLCNYLNTLNIKGHNVDTIRKSVSDGHWSMIENYGIDFIKEHNYDAIIMLESPSTPLTYAVFDANQIKLADPITYDDYGKIIPVSNRFDSSNNDIRY